MRVFLSMFNGRRRTRRRSEQLFSILIVWITFLVSFPLEEKSNSLENQWIHSKHLSDWLHPIDLCLIQDARNVSTEIILKDCEEKILEDEKKKKQSEESSLPPLRCRIGNTWPSRSKYCDASDIPFAERKHFQTILSPYDHPQKHVLKEFFIQLTQKKGILLLIGDSVMQQFFNAIACELVRVKVWTDYNTFTNTDEVQYVTSSQLLSASPHLSIQETSAMTMTMKAAIKFLPIYHFVDGRYDRKPQAAFHSLVTTLQDLITQYQTIYIVVNMGLHYIDNPAPGFSKNDYSKQMEKLLLYLHSFHQNYTINHHHEMKIIWRETSAQHFMTPNGYWPGIKYIRGMKLQCSPLQDPSAEADWRNREIEKIISKHHLRSTIKVLPFYNITVPLWSEHPNGHLKDCTHFCWTPMLYQSIFHYLKNTIDGRIP